MSQILAHLGHSSASALCLGHLHRTASRKGPRAWSLPRIMLPMPWGMSPLPSQGSVLSFPLGSPGLGSPPFLPPSISSSWHRGAHSPKLGSFGQGAF